MAYDLTALDALEQKITREGTSLFIRTRNKHTNALVHTYEFTNAPVAPTPVEVDDVARAIRTSIAMNIPAVVGGQIVTPDGGVVGGGSRVARPSIYGRLPIGRDTEAVGTAVHQHRYYVPFGGQTVQVRCVYRNTATATQMVTADSAVASGRSFSDLNPISETGAAVPFVAVGSGKTIDVAPSASVSRLGRSEWMTVRVIEDAARPGWGTIYVRSRFTSGGLAVRYEGGAGQTEFNAAAPLFKHIADFQALAAIGDNIGAGTLNDYRRAFWIEVRTLDGKVATVAAFGDSRVSGFGSAGNMHGWASRACEDLNAAGVLVGYENWGQASTNSASYMDRLNGRLALGDCPDVVLWQVGSNNDAGAWTEATVTSSIARMIEAKEKGEALGGIFSPCTMFPSSGANTADKVAQWRRLNNAARACKFFVDFDVSPLNNGAEIPALPAEFTVDGVHLNDTWQQFLADIAAPGVRRALGQ